MFFFNQIFHKQLKRERPGQIKVYLDLSMIYMCKDSSYEGGAILVFKGGTAEGRA